MKIEIDEGFVSLVAKNDAEAALLASIQEAINADSDGEFPARLVDMVPPHGGPESRIINGILQLQVS